MAAVGEKKSRREKKLLTEFSLWISHMNAEEGGCWPQGKPRRRRREVSGGWGRGSAEVGGHGELGVIGAVDGPVPGLVAPVAHV